MSGGGALGFSKSKGTTRPDVVQPYKNTPLEGLMAALATQLQGLTAGGGTANPLSGIPAAPQSLLTPVPATANENALLQQLAGNSGADQRQGYLNDVLSGSYLPGQANGNPFLQQAIQAAQRTNLEGLTQTLTRDLPGRFTAAGQFTQPQGSSAFDRAAALATRGVANANSDIATNALNTQFQAERQNQQAAVGLGQQEVQTTIANLQAQALPRLIQQYGVDQGLAEFQRQSSMLLQTLQLIAQVPGAFPVVASRSNQSSLGIQTEGHGGVGQSSS